MIPVSLILISQDLAQLQLTEDSSDCIYLSEDQDQFIQQLQNISREQQRLHLKNGGHLILKSGQFQYLPRGLQRLKLDSNNNNPFISLTDRVYAYLPSSLKILSLDMDSKFFKSAVCQPSFYERFPRLQLLHLQNTGNLNLTALCANAPKGVRVTDDVGVFFKEFRKPLSPLAEIVDPLLDVLSTTELTGDLVSMVVAYCAEDVLRRADIQGDMRALSPAMQKSLRQFAHTWTILDLSYLALTDESLCDILKCAENIRELAIRNCPVLTSVSVEYMRKLKSLTTLKTANELVSRIPCNKYPHGKIKELELQNINGGELHGLQAPLEKLTLINCPSLDQARLNSLPSTLRELAIIYTESSSSIAQTYFYSVIERQELPLLEKLEIISYESIPLRSWSHFQRMKNLKSFTYILKNPSLTTICLPLENGPRSLTHLHRSTVVTFNPRNVSRVYPVLQSLILENIQVVDYQMQELQQHLMNLPLQALAIPRPPDATNDEILEFATALAARQKLSVTSNESNADQIKFTLG